ncbi:hypothetical protein MY3296_006501 [Beauveria thailandica]
MHFAKLVPLVLVAFAAAEPVAERHATIFTEVNWAGIPAPVPIDARCRDLPRSHNRNVHSLRLGGTDRDRVAIAVIV